MSESAATGDWTLPPSLAQQVDQVCDAFEGAWKTGQRPQIEQFLEDAPEAMRSVLLQELLGLELAYRRRSGNRPMPEDYQQRFPGQIELINASFRKAAPFGTAESIPSPLVDLIPGGETSPYLATAPGPLAGQGLPDKLESGQMVSRYRLLGRLGRGGMGVVYRAQDTLLDRNVALKFLPQEYAQDRQRLERFQREARTASALNHPHICTIHDAGEYEGQPFMVMELVEGRTLRTLVGQRLSLEALARLVGQVARALGVAHAAGVVHRDVKPENVMVREDGYVKVLDFGLARHLPGGPAAPPGQVGKGTDPGIVVGTVRYMSPEQARGEAVDSATDVFSLGIVLYELATGRHPFQATSQLGVMHAILWQPPLPPSCVNPEIPAPLEALVQQMLEKDARLRPTAAEVDVLLTEMAGGRAGRKGASAAGPVHRHTVGRQKELDGLRAGWEAAVDGRGGVLCLAGEPGIGKTTLVEDFLNELTAGNPACGVARGRCSERLAGAEAYLPILEVLETLLRSETGESVARVMRAVAPTWYVQVVPLAKDDSSVARVLEKAKSAPQERMKRELLAFLQEVSRLRPLLVFLDDLHWADASTADLLAYVGGKCAAMRLLLVLTYRPSDLLLSKHPFAQVKLDLQARGICREVFLEFLSREDVERYLALEFPGHHFPEEFAAFLHAKTEGSPLFVVDLLRYLRDRKVVAAEQGRWVLIPSIQDLQLELPESVRSLIQRKIDQLDEGDRRLLAAASVQGSEFDSAVVAQALALDAAEVEERLEVLDRAHALIRLIQEREFPDRTLTLRYCFVHVLYQNALYASLRPTRRASLSLAVAQTLLGHYGERSVTLAAELALLFEAGRDFARATEYFLLAAQNAARVFATQEVVALSRRGLELLQRLPDTPERTQQEIVLQTTLGQGLTARGFADPEVNKAYARALELCEHVRDTTQLHPVLTGLFLFYFLRAEYMRAHRLGERILGLAQRTQDRAILLEANVVLGATSFFMGELTSARRHVEQGIAIHNLLQHRSGALGLGQDPGVASLTYAALTLWLLGYPDQSLKRMHEALARARELDHPFTLAFFMQLATVLHHLRREWQVVQDMVSNKGQFTDPSNKHNPPIIIQGFATFEAHRAMLHGWTLAAVGRGEEGTAQARQALTVLQAVGYNLGRPYYLALLAETCGRLGQIQAGLALVAEAVLVVDNGVERWWEAELYRLKGELLLALSADHQEDSETCFRQAIDTARRQGAKSLELRAAMSLNRLYQKQGKQEEARRLLAETYNWFTEGFDTLDLKEAKALLEGVPCL